MKGTRIMLLLQDKNYTLQVFEDDFTTPVTDSGNPVVIGINSWQEISVKTEFSYNQGKNSKQLYRHYISGNYEISLKAAGSESEINGIIDTVNQYALENKKFFLFCSGEDQGYWVYPEIGEVKKTLKGQNVFLISINFKTYSPLSAENPLPRGYGFLYGCKFTGGEDGYQGYGNGM